MFESLHIPSCNESKRNAICSAFYPHLRALSSLLPAITCLCSFNPPRYQTALEIIYDKLRAEEALDQEIEAPAESEDESEEELEENSGLAAMKWLLILVDPSIVYNVALGTYSMELTQMVASLSQRDPREYKPLIERYNSVPVGWVLGVPVTCRERRYLIDKELRRYALLLQDIGALLTNPAVLDPSTCVPPSTTPCAFESSDTLFKEAVQLLNERQLVREFIAAFKDSAYRTSMLTAVGQYYIAHNKFASAMEFLLMVSPRPYSLLLTCALQLNDVDTYLCLLADSVSEPRDRLRCVIQLCRQLRTGGKKEVLKAAALYVVISRGS